MEGHPLLQFHPILTHLATIPAIAIASYKALNLWRAVSALPLNPHSVPLSQSTSPSASSECLKAWRALTATKKAQKVAAFLIIFSLGVGFNLFLAYVLPKITSQSVFDAILCIILLACFTASLGFASNLAFPTPKSVRYHQKRPDGPVALSIAPEGDKTYARNVEIIRYTLSFLVTVGIMTSTWAGYTYFHPLLAASYLVMIVGSLRYPRMSIRRIVQIVSAYLAVIPVLSIVIGVVGDRFGGESTNDESKKDDTIASDWVISLMFIFSHIIGSIVPAILTAMTLRFEYSLVHEPIERSSETSSDAPVQIPTDYPSFPKPIFLASLVSLFLSLVVVETITYVVPQMAWLSITPLTVYITAPMVFGGAALGAAWCGKFSQWWRYSEVWIPSKKESNGSGDGAKDLNEEEVALLPSEAKDMA